MQVIPAIDLRGGLLRPPPARGLRPGDGLRRRSRGDGRALGVGRGDPDPPGRSRRGQGRPAGQCRGGQADPRPRRGALPARRRRPRRGDDRRLARRRARAGDRRHPGAARPGLVPRRWPSLSGPAGPRARRPRRPGRHRGLARRLDGRGDDAWPSSSTTCRWPAIIYTDIARDGMLEGPNLAATAALAGASKTPVIASGGVGRLEDLGAPGGLADRGLHRRPRLVRRSFPLGEAIGSGAGEPLAGDP